ncbi:M protein, serotype 5 [Octopus sinensis]|uniref:M protein, serotype 5 n=1 Tax=Octopus sinensis TaxID=2607531 RepID=A0A6P7T0H1_9MOLL|nr:M protein, serotype 5 [Octopus sinensis]
MENTNNNFLKDQVQRLNNHLLWYQTKYGYCQLPDNQFSPWLTEERILTPLLTEYDYVNQTLEEQLKHSSEEFKSLKEDLQKVLKENDDLRKLLKETLELEADALPEIIKETDSDQKTVENFRKQIALLTKEKETVTEMYQEAMSQVKQLTSDLQNLKSNQPWDDLEKQTNRMKNQYYTSVQSIVAEVEPLQKNLREKEKEVMNLKVNNETLQAAVEELKRKLKWKEQELVELAQKDSNSGDVVTNMKRQTSSLENDLKAKAEELKQLKEKNSELEKWIILQQEKNTTLEKQMQDMVEDRKNAQQIVENAILDKDLAKEVSAQRQEQINHLQKVVDDLMDDVGKATRKEVDDVKSLLNVRIVKLNEKVHFLEMERSEREVNMERCLRDKKNVESELQNVRQNFVEETKSFNEVKEKLTQRLTEALKSKDATERKLDKFEHQQERDKKNLNQKIDLLMKENEKLKEQVSSLNGDNSRLSESKLQLIQEINELKANILQANNERDEIQRNMRKRIAVMKEEMSSNSQDFELKLQSFEDGNHYTMVELKKLLNSQKIISRRWKEECSTISKKYDEKIAQIRSELKRYKTRNSELKSSLQECQVKMTESGQVLKDYTAKIQRMESHLREAQNKAMESERKLTHLQMKHREIASENIFLLNESNKNENNSVKYSNSHVSVLNNSDQQPNENESVYDA